jgi:DNA-binding Lrp family transcriptional regulator
MNDMDRQIVGLLALHPEGLPAAELRAQIDPVVSQPTLWRHLDRLLATGMVRRIGAGRATRYLGARSDHALLDLRSRALHLAVGRRLVRDPSLLQQARQQLDAMRARTGQSSRDHERWAELLDGPLEVVLGTLGSYGEEATQLRHTSPFAGVLDREERERVLSELGLTRRRRALATETQATA